MSRLDMCTEPTKPNQNKLNAWYIERQAVLLLNTKQREREKKNLCLARTNKNDRYKTKGS